MKTENESTVNLKMVRLMLDQATPWLESHGVFLKTHGEWTRIANMDKSSVWISENKVARHSNTKVSTISGNQRAVLYTMGIIRLWASNTARALAEHAEELDINTNGEGKIQYWFGDEKISLQVQDMPTISQVMGHEDEILEIRYEHDDPIPLPLLSRHPDIPDVDAILALLKGGNQR